RYALAYDEFYEPKELETAKALLAQGAERARALRAGDAPWTKATGLVVLGYVSKIDGSVQPYGLVVPETWTDGAGMAKPRRHRLDFFCHGRGEKLTELSFIDQRQKSPGEFTPPDAFVLHPYGRYCNANRFAGEVDLFEALDDVKRRYPIDADRIVARGFSMGGASAWQYATHHADLWAAAAPGAGFSETVGFLRLDAPGRPPRPWYEQKLWNWYDATAYAVNLAQLPTVAYNGDQDGQKQAADRMQDAMSKEGLTLTRVVGPETGHKYHPESKKQINAFVDAAVAKGRERTPLRIRFTTWTLRYNKMNWLTVTGLERHWERARVDAERTAGGVVVKTENVSRFALAPEVVAAGKPVVIDGQKLTGGGARFAKSAAGRWAVERGDGARQLRKVPGLQGPIDDAFLDSFVMVRPTGRPLNPQVGAWVESEMPRAVREWRAMFRGEARVRDDKAVTDADIAGSNLVLWGDPSSNAVLAKIAPKLPIRWEKDGTVRVGGKSYAAGTSVPVLIYPNPLNPRRYVVLNSGITWREGHYFNNAEQYARLPDWAVVDVTTPPDKFAPGRIAEAGFFDEAWQVRADADRR
ncbi:MAG TPA: prolyl oligopeptidase family serine peptidase, partial [Armatimonadaceae bacterium]|nr:prolyl oligopeptidase family serine peptidase [Armatimonadaceae bacterium]